MFPPVSERLKSPTGTLEQLPLPLLLHALWESRSTVQLGLSGPGGRERRLLLREGAPVACEPGAPGESLLGLLVEQGLVDAAHARRVEGAAQVTGVLPEALLVQQGVVDAEAVERTRRGLLARRVLECFGAEWARARYVLGPAPAAVEGVGLAVQPLLLAGVARMLPVPVVAALVPPGLRLRRAVPPPAMVTPLPPEGREAGVLDLLSEPLSAPEVAARSNLSAEEAARRLLSLALLGLVEPAPAAAAFPRRRVVVVRFLRREHLSLEALVGEEPHVDLLLEEPGVPGRDELLPPDDADITGIIPTHRLPPLPSAGGGAPARAARPSRGVWLAAGAAAALAVATGTAVVVLGDLLRAPPPPPPAVVEAPRPPPEPELETPVPQLAAAPAGARAQPHVPRGLQLSASGMVLPLPVPARGSPGAAQVLGAARQLARGDAAAALPRFEAVTRRVPGSAEAWYGAALSLYALERDAEARERLQRALEAVPEHAGSHLLMGFLAQQAAALSEARQHYERFLATAPDPALAADVADLLAQLP